VTLEVAAGAITFSWAPVENPSAAVATGRLTPNQSTLSRFQALDWRLQDANGAEEDGCGASGSAVRALLNRIRKRMPLADDTLRLGLLTDANAGPAQAGRRLPIALPPGSDAWKWLGREMTKFASLAQLHMVNGGKPETAGREALTSLAGLLLGEPYPGAASPRLPELCVTFDQMRECAEFVWRSPDSKTILATGCVRYTDPGELTWELDSGGQRQVETSSPDADSVRSAVNRWVRQLPADRSSFTARWVKPNPAGPTPIIQTEPPFDPEDSPLAWVVVNIVVMAEGLQMKASPLGRMMREVEFEEGTEYARFQRKLARKEQKLAEEEARRREAMTRKAAERGGQGVRQKTEPPVKETKAAPKAPSPGAKPGSNTPLVEQPPLPPVRVRFEVPALALQETAFPLSHLRDFSLRERAALWWVSNQSDDLLCLPNCRIQHLDYQLRTVLRVLGPLRGRALLSDEVGLGKTIEAGLIIKELLTRGMVKRFLVLTVPSLVDQWEEELQDKFGLATATTNQTAARDDAGPFWRDHTGVVASLHTLKQPAHLEIARQIQWDILVVDEAHYLRNRDSQAWQAVNALPRQFLLLLTATPVQNSLEELYNLVTLLQPGQLPSPKEFRARFFDPKRPRQPREPEELRRLLGQVMIRNTRANAGLHLPPRRAETVLFEPAQAERAFWQRWEAEFRACLAKLNASQASLWGRLLLQAAGSSPAAWRAVLEKFPDAGAASAWREQSLLDTSWLAKCNLIPPLARREGGVVIFTQFLETQAALADHLTTAGIRTFVINGSTPPPERQPITEAFRKTGGALILTHSGTEGRNLQFCHTLANFDLPWNPMEIEQRIGRLHRLGQEQPVRICNFVQAGTLQEHLLDILQEKLNLFELVVGETGLVLGERYSGEEFAEEIFRRWRDSGGSVPAALAQLGDELAAARDHYADGKKLDETLFAKNYEMD
jgi:hypothetical protein